MKLFKDTELKEEIVTLDFGIVDAGGKKEYNFYVQNDSKAVLNNIDFAVIHPEVQIVSAPKTLKSQEVAKLVLEWNPSVTLKEGLKTTLKVSATELWS